MKSKPLLFCRESIEYLQLNLPRIEKCLALVTEAEVWEAPNEQTNSIGNLLLHLCGNITQWVIANLGNRPDLRERDLEFSTQGGFSKMELLAQITKVIEEASAVILDLEETQLQEPYVIQGLENSGYGVVIHIVEHCSYHVGQIAFLTKVLRDVDLGFYANMDLNS